MLIMLTYAVAFALLSYSGSVRLVWEDGKNLIKSKLED